MIVTYNLCFSTILGRVRGRGREGGREGGSTTTTGKLGVMSYPQERTAKHLATLLVGGREGGRAGTTTTKQQCFVAPSGAMFVPAKERQGVLPRMLHEILQTRFMVKKGEGGREGGRKGGREGG